MLSLFFRKKFQPEIETPKLDTTALDLSLSLLRSTTSEVSQAAVNAAKVLEQRLSETESRLYSIIDSIDDFVLIKDGEGKWKTLNSFGQGMYGWKNYEYLGKTDYELAEEYPEFKEHLYQCLSSDVQAWERAEPIRSEEMAVVNGKIQYFDVIKTPVFDKDENRKELIIVGRNVTEIKEKNKRVKACFTALNSSSDVIAICDSHGYITFCNDKFLMKFGFHDHRDVVGKKMSIISSGKTSTELYENLWETIKNNKTWVGDITNKTAKGVDINCRVTILPVMNGRPEPIYYICTMKPSMERD